MKIMKVESSISPRKNPFTYYPKREKMKQLSLSAISMDNTNKHDGTLRKLTHRNSWVMNQESSTNQDFVNKRSSNNKSVQSQDYSDTDINDIREVKRLKKLFMIYTNNEKSLNSTKFSKLLNDSKIINNSTLTKPIVDILFHKENKSKNFFTFENFCNVLVEISKIVYPNEGNEHKAFGKLFNKHLLSLLINLNCNLYKDFFEEKIDLLKAEKRILTMIEKNFLLFIKMYEKYFPWEFSKLENNKKNEFSEQSYLKFLKDFELTPSLVSKNKAVEIYQNLIHHKKDLQTLFSENEFPSNLGTAFTIYNFIFSIFLISLNSSNNATENNTNDYYSFKSLIDKLYILPAIKNILTVKQSLELKSLNKEENKVHHIKSKSSFRKKSTSVENLFSTINQDLSSMALNNNPNKSMSFSEINAIQNEESDNIMNNIINNDNFEDFDLDKKFINKYKNILIQVFKYYANLSDSSNFIFLNVNIFIKLMKDMGLLENVDNTTPIKNEFIKNMESLDKKSATLGRNLSLSINKNLSLTINKNMSTTFRKSQTLVSYNLLNLLFSKFSCEVEDTKEEMKINNINYLSYKRKNSIIRLKNIRQYEKIKSNSNKRINFCEFLKIIICVAIYISNPLNKTIRDSQSSFNISKTFHFNSLLDVDSRQLHFILEKFIIQYYVPIYNDIKSHVDNREDEVKILRGCYNDQNNQCYIEKFQPIFKMIFDIYSDERGYIFQEEFMLFCLEFDIFPQIVSKNRLYFVFAHSVDNLENLITNGNSSIFINFTSFMGLLMFISIDSKCEILKQYPLKEKIITFFRILCQSRGLDKCVLVSGKEKIKSDFQNAISEFKKDINKIDKPQSTKLKKTNFKDIILQNK